MGTKRPGEFEQLLLFALVRLGDAAYGTSIREEIERRADRSVAPGAIYTAMDRLEKQGLVSSRLGEATPARGGRRKKYYRIEPSGARALAESYEALQGMSSGILPELRALVESGPGEVRE